MTAAEFTAAGELLFGRWFKSPLARLLNRDRNTLRKYATGKARIRPSLAAEIRATVNIGPVGRAIRNSIKKSMPEMPTFTAHRMAKQIALDLASLGILAEIPSSDNGGCRIERLERKRD